MEEHEYQVMYDVEKTHWWFVSRRLFLESMFRHIGIGVKRLTIADIGAGTGGMFSLLKRYGTVIGIEPHHKARKLAKKRGISLRADNAERTKLATRSMDMVCLFDVLYHRGIDDRKALAEANRILKPGGLLIVTDCAMPWLAGPHDRAVHGRIRYTSALLGSRVAQAGFGIRKISYMFFFLFPWFAMKRLVDRFFNVKGCASDVSAVPTKINEMCIFLHRIESWILPFVSYPYGSSVLVVARKEGSGRAR